MTLSRHVTVRKDEPESKGEGEVSRVYVSSFLRDVLIFLKKLP